MMKNKSNAGKTRKLGNLISLTGSGVINCNPCDHWMSPLFLECSNSRAAGKECARTHGHDDDSYRFQLDSYRNAIPNAHVGAEQQQGTLRNTLWIQLPPGSLGVCLMVNNAALSGAGWQIPRGSLESRIISQEMWRKPGLEHGADKKDPCAITGERKGEQEQGCQHRAAESCLSKAAKRAEKTRRTSVTPWGALHIKALRALVDESWRRQRKAKTNPKIPRKTPCTHPSLEVRPWKV